MRSWPPSRCEAPFAPSRTWSRSATASIFPRPERLALARALCSSGYLSRRPLSLGPEGGIVGLPRAIDKNFEAWREGPNVWICPTKRTNTLRPVYQFIREDGAWRFDGPVAILRPWGEVVRTTEMPELESP